VSPLCDDWPVGRYRLADALLLPSLISWVRLPLAAAFPWTIGDPPIACAILFAAGLSDVLDGYVARSRGQATATGAVIDPITDKLFVLTVVLTLIAYQRIPWWGALLLGARDIGEAPLVLWWAVSHRRRRAKADAPKANLPGKLATALQFIAVTAALFGSPWTISLLFAAAGAGAVAAVAYWIRDLGAGGAIPSSSSPG
jgi:CDP-diacylglycerol--glycerol-3-phosphate 3-phosphatidyltransferase/cardiolipin synthase